MYGKIFKSLFYGTLCGQSDAQLVFVCLIAHADRDGDVELPPAVIATVCGLTSERISAAIGILEACDPESRSPELDGRRLNPGGPGRWSIVNYEKCRGIRDEDERRTQTREATRRYRAKKSASSSVSRRKSRVSQREPLRAQGEGEGEVEVERHFGSTVSGNSAGRHKPARSQQ